MSTRVINFGIIGTGYGSSVLMPAILLDGRAKVVALAGNSFDKVRKIAIDNGVPYFSNSWQKLLEECQVDAIAVAVPPRFQPEILREGINRGIAIYAEKPLSTNIVSAQELARGVKNFNIPNVIDFNFSGVAAFQEARHQIQRGAIGRLRHVVINWEVENYSNKNKLLNWKADSSLGGGTLFNFVSHCFHYLEWLSGDKIDSISSRLWSMPDDLRPSDSTVALHLEFLSQMAGAVVVSAAAPGGSGHEISFYGENGSLRLINNTDDYMGGFTLMLTLRGHLGRVISLPAEVDTTDGRIKASSVLISRLIDEMQGLGKAHPDLDDGLRVQILIEAAKKSNLERRWVQA